MFDFCHHQVKKNHSKVKLIFAVVEKKILGIQDLNP